MRILVLANNDIGLYNFRKELLARLIKDGNEVYISLPEGDKVKPLEDMGLKLIDTQIDRRGINPITDIKLFITYINIIKSVQPSVILTYTIKPNIYGSTAARICGIPYLVNITGLGTAFENDGWLRHLISNMYKIALKRSNCVFFQNQKNRETFEMYGLISGNNRLLPGSGVNLDQFSVLEYPSNETLEFVFISRIMKEKGIDQYLECAEYIRKRYPNTRFHICGFCEEAYQKKLKELHDNGVIMYHGLLSDVREVLKVTHCTIHPSYHEGMSNVLLESSASGRPCLCSDIPGCREIVNDGGTGFLFEPKRTESLINAVEKFIELPYDLKKQFGVNARRKVEKEFDRQIVIDAYMDEINKISKGGIYNDLQKFISRDT